MIYTVIWGQLFIEGWMRKEKILAFSFDAKENSFDRG